MLHLLQNNFIISLIVGLCVLIYVHIQNKNNKESKGIVFYVRLWALVFFLVLSVLYLKTRDLSLPSLKPSQSFAPVQHAGASGVINNIPAPSYTPNVDLGLEKVNLGDPNF